MGWGLKAWDSAGRLAGLGLMGLVLAAMPAQAAPKCQFVKVASLPVKMEGNSPLIQGSIRRGGTFSDGAPRWAMDKARWRPD